MCQFLQIKNKFAFLCIWLVQLAKYLHTFFVHVSHWNCTIVLNEVFWTCFVFFFCTPFSIWMVFKEPKKLNGEHVVKAWAKKMPFNKHPIFSNLLKLQCLPNLNWSNAWKRMVQGNLTGCINVLVKYLFFESNQLKNK